MASKIFSKISDNGIQSLYLRMDGREFYLFSQKGYNSVRAFYGKELPVDCALDFSLSTGRIVSRTMEKLRMHIRYIEKEYGISVFKKTMNARRPKKTARNQHYRDEVA